MTHNTNHNLIEIAKKLSDALEQDDKLSTPQTRGTKTYRHNNLKEWLKENYDNDGIREERYKKYFGEKSKIA